MLAVNPTFAQLLRSPTLLLAFGFGSGLSPKAPGTMGTLAAIPLWWLLAQLPLTSYLIVVSIAAVVGIAICGRAADQMGVHDHGGIVWDEFVGFWIAMAALPITWQSVVLGFVLFRVFDILKPWPISWLDKKVSGGFGIMIDDVIAGLAAAVVIYFLGYFGLIL
ncbi:MAG: phosphatidylglycerophosphatase A [Porticoccaceae bacterium]|nr:phosphatidylglycerophosphatase A [Porticoccaceae bacterium]MBT6592778.1 phosphatidylglycerophosphatase A [Porticoccaceae bacterium]MDB4581307.1 phosphatidylglycerophosphatase A [Porticoccaceae bacterium]MDC0588137.1 phosphatidylglycerophosphatase A [Porticoccaceae bacterium]MDG1079802.1 phosphatidylglycerophosphatase A [Porticoccaceae bacterium]